LNKGREVLLNALFPLKCVQCSAFYETEARGFNVNSMPIGLPSAPRIQTLSESFEHFMAPFLCQGCRDTFVPIEAPLCSICGNPFLNRKVESHVCGKCLQAPPLFSRARALGVYQDGFKEVIHHFKYKGKSWLGKMLGRLLFQAYTEWWTLDEFDMVLPVPLHPKRQRQRGFNQAYVLVKEWPVFARKWIPGRSTLTVEYSLLRRKGWTNPQVGLDPKSRLQNVRGAFDISPPCEMMTGKRVLLVDDVYTTGATLSECTRLLLRKGAARVEALTLAKALR
jgi:ComF family protein